MPDNRRPHKTHPKPAFIYEQEKLPQMLELSDCDML